MANEIDFHPAYAVQPSLAITFGAKGGVPTFVSADNPFPVAVIAGGGGGGGATTEYTEDAAAPANPIGGTMLLRRRDALSASEVGADGDFIAVNATAKGEMVTHDGDAIVELQAVKTALATIQSSASNVKKMATSLASTNATNVKNAAGAVDGVKATNNSDATILVHLFDKATAPTIGSDAAVDVLEIPAGAIGFYDFPLGIGCAAGIGYALTAADGSTAVVAGDVTNLSIYYR